MTRKRKGEEHHYLDPETADIIAGDLPDGAYWAMMEELTGEEPGAIVDILEHGPADRPKKKGAPRWRCHFCKKRFGDGNAVRQHERDAHPGEKA